ARSKLRAYRGYGPTFPPRSHVAPELAPGQQGWNAAGRGGVTPAKVGAGCPAFAFVRRSPGACSGATDPGHARPWEMRSVGHRRRGGRSPRGTAGHGPGASSGPTGTTPDISAT